MFLDSLIRLVNYGKWKDCGVCHGAGEIRLYGKHGDKPVKCPMCDGYGKVYVS